MTGGLAHDFNNILQVISGNLEIMSRLLARTPDAITALKLVADAALRVDAIFTDVVLPGGMSGPEVVDRIRAKRPQVPALFTSGYTPESVGAHPRLANDRHVLMKPYRIEALADAIRRTIDEAGDPFPGE